MAGSVEAFMSTLVARNPGEVEFHQAAHEVIASIWPAIERRKEYREANILERFVEPERVVQFRVPWVDDGKQVQVHRGYRVEFSSAIGPYKGGLRFRDSVNLSVLKFLGFEQVIKNSLTTLPLGGGKGGSNFDPRGKSDGEVMRFCQSFMSELFRHIGADTDVPAGDIGVGGREIGFLFGQYKRLRNAFEGSITGKGVEWGGSHLRPEATGFGCVYFVEQMLKTRHDNLEGKRVVISGSGNVSQYAARKCMDLGAKVIALSDSDGFVVDPDGLDEAKWRYVIELKQVRRGRIQEYAKKFKGAKYQKGGGIWSTPCDVALPCATQNELAEADAKTLVKNKCVCVAEGANMPTTPGAVDVLQGANVLFAPGKASNAGGVAVSGLEMSQNGQRTTWAPEMVDDRLRSIMAAIHEACVTTAKEFDDPGNYVLGANVAGFRKVANAMLDQGVV